MKVFIGTKKEGKRQKLGVTVYSEKGTVLYSDVRFMEEATNKFDYAVDSLEWVVKKLKTKMQNKSLPEEDMVIFMGSKTLYTWLEREEAPEPYTQKISNLFIEMSFFLSHTEIVYSKSALSRVLFRKSEKEVLTKITDMFGN